MKLKNKVVFIHMTLVSISKSKRDDFIYLYFIFSNRTLLLLRAIVRLITFSSLSTTAWYTSVWTAGAKRYSAVFTLSYTNVFIFIPKSCKRLWLLTTCYISRTIIYIANPCILNEISIGYATTKSSLLFSCVNWSITRISLYMYIQGLLGIGAHSWPKHNKLKMDITINRFTSIFFFFL